METNTTLGNNCGCKNNSDCNALMQKIRQVNFALVETILYLDAYPCSSEALEHYHCLKKEAEELKEKYESTCGPLTALGNQSRSEWSWIKSPWPWHTEAN